ncbi:MAG: hypothetical protein RL095_2317 [Verrucomicrobiota bacterium]|jgi:signal transduction histidine kinase
MNRPLVMIVDDVPDNIQVAARFLQEDGCSVAFATSGAQALQALARLRPQLILLDIDMPEMNGFQLIEKLAAHPDTAQIPVIFLTAMNDDKSLQAGFQLGAVDFITKPFRSVELCSRVRTHIRLRKAELRAEAASRSKSRFLANISHELRTPLNSVLGWVEMLQLRRPDEATRNALDNIERSGKSLLGLINELLDLASAEEGRMKLSEEDCSLLHLVEDVVQELLPLVERRRLQLQVDCAPRCQDAIHSDPRRLRQILLNLLSNAVKFTDSGTIRLKVATEAADRGLRLRLQVEDSGIGISAEEQARIFAPFWQAEDHRVRHRGGTGLGLPISRTLCEMMGGSLTVSSSPGAGSVFTAEILVRAALDPGFASPGSPRPVEARGTAVPDPAMRAALLQQIRLFLADGSFNQASALGQLLGHLPPEIRHGRCAPAFSRVLRDIHGFAFTSLKQSCGELAVELEAFQP